jgi:hypothetical protein
MFLKLIDEHGTPKLVNLANAQSVEKYVDEEEDNPLFRSGIRIIWHDQILQNKTSTEELDIDNDIEVPYFYSEQLYFGISITGLEKLLIQQTLLIPPAPTEITMSENGTGKHISKLAPEQAELPIELLPDAPPELTAVPPAPVEKPAPAVKKPKAAKAGSKKAATKKKKVK